MTSSVSYYVRLSRFVVLFSFLAKLDIIPSKLKLLREEKLFPKRSVKILGFGARYELGLISR